MLEVWEHHRIGDLQIPSPITFHFEPVGATATLIAEQFFLNDIKPPPAIAGALLAAILSDTLVLASPTTSNKDRRMAPKLAALAGVDVSEFGAELMAARGDIATRSARDFFSKAACRGRSRSSRCWRQPSPAYRTKNHKHSRGCRMTRLIP